ncbi:MAG: fasciclin domain-containing protein [Sphingomicrobium sp.]
MTKFNRPSMLITAAAAALAIGACSPSAEAPPANDMAAINDMAPSPDMAIADSAPVTVGGAEMLPTRTIVENASAASNLTTLVSAVTAAGLVETLSGAGPFTVFAPTNDAFAKLPAGTVEGLVKPAAKADLTKILTYHVVSGKMSAADLTAAIAAGGGKAELTTVQGAKLTATASGDTITLTDAKGGKSTVSQADVNQSNGVVHVIDTVLMPA